MFERSQMLLSDRFNGFFMVPDTNVWNYNFQGVNHSPAMQYRLKLDQPLEFYHELHRPSHYLSFAALESSSSSSKDNVMEVAADDQQVMEQEDMFQ